MSELCLSDNPDWPSTEQTRWIGLGTGQPSSADLWGGDMPLAVNPNAQPHHGRDHTFAEGMHAIVHSIIEGLAASSAPADPFSYDGVQIPQQRTDKER